MEDFAKMPSVAASPPSLFTHLAKWCAYASGSVSAVGIISLITFYTIGGVAAYVPDVSVTVQYALMLPIALEVHRLVRPLNRALSGIAVVAGCAAMVTIVILQCLLLAGVLPLRQQLVLAVPAFLVVLWWFVFTGHLGRATDQLPRGPVLHVLAGLYFGYPVWAFLLGQRLTHRSPTF